MIGFNIADTVTDGVVISNTATVDWDFGGPAVRSAVAAFEAVECLEPEADVSIVKNMPSATVYAGETITAVLTVLNASSPTSQGSAVDVVVQDQIPWPLYLASWDSDNAAAWGCDSGGLR